MLFPDYFLTVRASVEPGREAEFNRWYDTVHIPDAVRLFPGCLGASRYRVVEGDGSHQFIAVYAFASEAAMTAALAGPGLQQLIGLFDAAVGSFSTRSRTTYASLLHYSKPTA